MDLEKQVDVFFLRGDHVIPRFPDGRSAASRNMASRQPTHDPGERKASVPVYGTENGQYGHDNVCFDLSPPESRMSMDSSFEGKSISTVSSYYSVSFQSSLNELVSMSSAGSRKKVRFQLDKTRKPYEDEWSLEDFRQLSDPDSNDTSSLKRCTCVCQAVTWVVICLGLVFCCLVLHDVTAAGITLLLSRILVTTAVQITGNPIGVLLLGLWTFSMYSSAFLLPMLAGLDSHEGFSSQQTVLVLLGSIMAVTIFPVLISLVFICDRVKFRRAFAAAILFYVYAVLTVIVVLPIEVASGMLYHIGRGVTLSTSSASGVQLFHTVVSMVTNVIIQIDTSSLANLAKNKDISLRRWCGPNPSPHTPVTAGGNRNQNAIMVTSTVMPAGKCTYLLDSTDLSDLHVAAILLSVCVLLFVILFFCAMQITKLLLRRSHTHESQSFFNRQFKGNCRPITGCFVIVIATSIVVILQNKMVLICICLILVANGFLSLSRYYEILIGANIGGSLSLFLFAQASPQNHYTAAMSLAASGAILQIFSAIVWYPIPIMRRQPMKIAKVLAISGASYRWFAVVFVLLVYAVIPLVLYGFCLLSGYLIIPIGVPVVLIIIAVVVINTMQSKCPSYLPNRLRTWDFVPYCMRSLEPCDNCLSRCCCSCRNKDRKDTPNDSLDGAVITSVSTSSTPETLKVVNGHAPASILKNHANSSKRETIV